MSQDKKTEKSDKPALKPVGPQSNATKEPEKRSKPTDTSFQPLSEMTHRKSDDNGKKSKK